MKKSTKYRTLTFETLETRAMPSTVALAGDVSDSALLGSTEIVAQAIPIGTGLPGSDLNPWGTGNLPWWNSDLLAGGDGNTYFLTESGDSIGRVVWLFAMYYGDQARTVPVATTQASAKTNEEWNANYGLFGTKLSSAVYYDEYPDARIPKKTPKELLDEAAPQPEKKPENRLELKLNPELDRKLRELLEPETPRENQSEEEPENEEEEIQELEVKPEGQNLEGNRMKTEQKGEKGSKPIFTSDSLLNPAISGAQIMRMITDSNRFLNIKSVQSANNPFNPRS